MQTQAFSLGAIGFKRLHRDADGNACTAMVAVWPIGKSAAATKSVCNEFAVDAGVDQVAGRSNL